MTGYVRAYDLDRLATPDLKEKLARIDEFRGRHQYTYWYDRDEIGFYVLVEVRVRRQTLFTGRRFDLGSMFPLTVIPTYAELELVGLSYAKRIIRDSKNRAFWKRGNR